MINAIICEFNPFHNGHKYLLEKAKQKTQAGATVCIMSGNFMQRGEASLWDKHTRAAAAVKNGADLVLQIPTAHSLAGASVFASSGVFIASSLGVETALCFGSESEDISSLKSMAEIDRNKLETFFKDAISKGVSHAAAAQMAYESMGCDASLIKKPNNLLAFEYLKAIKEQKSSILPVNIQRAGTDHDCQSPKDFFASASYIRNHISEDMSGFAPSVTAPMLDKSKMENLVLFSLYNKTRQELFSFADMTEGIENRFYEVSRNAKTLNQVFEGVKSKRYTASRIRRTAYNVFLQNPKGLYKQTPPCLKVLAFNDRGRALLKDLAQKALLPIITKPADYKKLGSDHFELECRASDLYDFCLYRPKGGSVEYRQSPIYIKSEE